MDLKERTNQATNACQGQAATFMPIHIAPKPVYCFVKRVFDIVFSVLALVILLVPMLIIALIIYIDSPGAMPVYMQPRIGKDGRQFKFYKFRSMIPNAEAMLEQIMDQNEMDGPVFKIRNDPRITRVGRFIRRTSIDELPQLWNILKGDMSFVGPRPPLPREVALYNEEQMQRLKVIPGMTCYWQVQPSRNDLPFDTWLKLDLDYISQRSFKTDFIILCKTVGAVFGMEGE